MVVINLLLAEAGFGILLFCSVLPLLATSSWFDLWCLEDLLRIRRGSSFLSSSAIVLICFRRVCSRQPVLWKFVLSSDTAVWMLIFSRKS